MKHTFFQYIRRGTLIISAALLAVGTSLFAFPLRAHAQPATGIAITPPLFELSANPGNTLKHSIRVDNLTDQPMSLGVDRRDFVAVGEEGQAELTEKPTIYSLSTWIKPDSDNIDIPPKGSTTVNFTIEVPAKAEPGGHFGSIVFKTKPKPDGTNTIVSQEIGALILLKVAGEAKESASILNFMSTRSLWQSGPIDFEARFKNEGNVQVKPTGTITISNIFGQKVGSVTLDSRTVLPESVRKMRGTWRGAAWPGWYTATLSLNYGNKNQIITSSTKFIVFPYAIILPIVGVMVVLGVFIYRGRKRLGRSLRILFGRE